MPPQRAKRKRNDLKKTFCKDSSDELSESGTSGSSFNLSDSDEDSSSEDSNSIQLASTKNKDNRQKARKHQPKHYSKPEVKNGNCKMTKSQLMDSKNRKSIDNGPRGTLPAEFVKKGGKLVENESKALSKETKVDSVASSSKGRTSKGPESSQESSESDFFSSDDSIDSDDYRVPAPKWTHTNKKIIELVCKRLREGARTKTVAQEFNVPKSRVTQWRCRYIPPEERVVHDSSTASNEVVRECCNLFKQGTPVDVLTKRYGIAENTIRHWRYKFAPETIQSTGSKKYDDGTILEACRQLRNGDSLGKVASIMNIPIYTMRKWQYRYLANIPEAESGGSCSYNQYTQLEALHQLKQGVAPEVVAKDLNIDINLLLKWKDEKLLTLKVEPVDQLKYDKKYVLNVCQRLQRGERAQRIAKDLGITPTLVYKWRDKYCLNKKYEPKDGIRYDKNTILKALELIKRGYTDQSVARKLHVERRVISTWRTRYLKKEEYGKKVEYHDLSIVSCLIKRAQRSDESTVLEACRLMKKGESTKDVADKLKVDVKSVRVWRRNYLIKSQLSLKDTCERVKFQVCKRLKQGDLVSEVSKEFGINKEIVYLWRRKYLPELCFQPLMRSSNGRFMSSTLKSKSKVISEMGKLVQSKNGKCSARRMTFRSNTMKSNGQERRVFIPIRKIYIPRTMKLQFVKMIEEGASIGKLSKDLNVNELTIKSWVLNQELLEKSSVNGSGSKKKNYWTSK